MNHNLIAIFINLAALIIALLALWQQQAGQPIYLKIEVEYGRSRQ